MSFKNILITGTGRSIPAVVADHNYFRDAEFFDAEKQPVNQSGIEAAKKLESITGIAERRYAGDGVITSDMATEAAQLAISDAGINPETIDQIILAHNFGDLKQGTFQGDFVPSLASRVKHNLKISNPNCVAYDIIFGCPGWLQAMIQAYSYMQSGLAKTCLIIGAETLSRVTDPHDRDSMIYADGAGATILQLTEEEQKRGILSLAAQSFTEEEAYFLFSGTTYHPTKKDDNLYIKMHGRKIYEFALNAVPKAMKAAFNQSGKQISELKKIFIHQANEKMDAAIVKRFYRLFKMEIPENIMPMSINKLGNSSVATIPTLIDLVNRGQMGNHVIEKGDIVMFASVGAGMNVNAVVYEV